MRQIEKILFSIAAAVVNGTAGAGCGAPAGHVLFRQPDARVGSGSKRLTDTTQNALVNIVTILLGLAVGSRLAADQFLLPSTLGILLLGLFAFATGTAAGILMAKLMNRLSRNPINPLIGGAGVSAVPMAARTAHRLGEEADPENFLLNARHGTQCRRRDRIGGCGGNSDPACRLISVSPLKQAFRPADTPPGRQLQSSNTFWSMVCAGSLVPVLPTALAGTPTTVV